MGAEDRVRELVEPQVTSRDLELYDVELNGGILRIAVDRPGGVPLDEITKLSRVISVLLDEDEDVVPGRYTLEVSSPGLERTLRTPEHFTKSVGSAVRLRTTAAAAAEATDGTKPERRLRGTLTAADDEAITVAPEGGGAERRLRYDQIDRAKTVFEWGPTPRPGKGKKEAAKR